jgi:outer membrane protein assembly factor BamA
MQAPRGNNQMRRVIIGGALFLMMAQGAAYADARLDVSSLGAYEGFLVTDVTVTGFRVTKEFIIRREIRINPGDTFHADVARGDLTRLENLGIFSSHAIRAQTSDSTIALTYVVREMPWIVPYPKVKYTETDGWSAGAGVASVNMFGRAIYLAGYGTLGAVDVFSLVFHYPWITGNHISLNAVLSDDQRFDPLNDFKEHSREITPWLGWWLGDSGRMGVSVSWFQMNADRDSITISPDRRDDYLRYGAHGGFDTRDTWRNPRRGWNSDLLVMRYDAGVFGGDGDWTLYELDVRRYLPLGAKHTLLLGNLLSFQDGLANQEIPGYLQYRMGGANSIRGHDIEVLGKELYGKNQWIFTTEFQRELIPIRETRFGKWSVSIGLDAAVFVDVGNAWDKAKQFNADRSRTGFGIGLRFLVPAVYEIRTDVAMGDDGEIHFHLGVGDKLTAQRARLR